ncbi:MAG: flagellar hook-basal body complex protein FliE [Clostridia bacterium]|nr:flagellar hook-basal body complex protein FliE [Clostridia bacterium]
MDITSLYNVSSDIVKEAASHAATSTKVRDESFGSLLDSAMSNISDTNSLLNNSEEEQIKFAMGLSENTHDLSIAAAKASTALSYTVALRDKFIEAYKEIMQIQV